MNRAHDVELTLRRVTTFFRIFATGWMLVLAVITLAGGVDKPVIIVATMVGISSWTVVALRFHFSQPEILRSWAFVAFDIATGAWALLAPTLADTTLFSGGYPFAPLFASIYARGWTGAIAASIPLTAAAAVRLAQLGISDPANASANLVAYAFSAAAATVVFDLLRRTDARRREAEAALEMERTERIRAEERSSLASHLHDSVLQTLALIQRRAADDREVTTLARQQERELRDWLYGTTAGEDWAGFAAAIKDTAAEVEGLHDVTIDTITVGDCAINNNVRAVVQAAREALVNAAKHADVSEIALYAEAVDGKIEVFVRDRGSGFDIDSIDDDRRGVTDSIVARMERHGGRASISTEPGRGTEVKLVMNR